MISVADEFRGDEIEDNWVIANSYDPRRWQRIVYSCVDEADTDVFSDVIAGLQDEARREREGVWSVLRFYSLQAFLPQSCTRPVLGVSSQAILGTSSSGCRLDVYELEDFQVPDMAKNKPD